MTPKTGRPNLLLPGVIAVVVVAALVTLIVTVVSGDEDKPTTDFDTTAAVVEGKSLQPLPADDDPAVGEPAPTIEGIGLDGSQIVAPASGRPTVLVFVAHWCPHCRAEVPVVQQWVDEGNLPDGVDLVGVATAMNPERPNYPPSTWLDDEGWTAPTIADATGVAAKAYGLSAFPFWVAIDAQGDVVARTTGELTTDQLESLVQAAMTTATTTAGT
jgi:thiol-disulfide isomerase/thioredoxin